MGHLFTTTALIVTTTAAAFAFPLQGPFPHARARCCLIQTRAVWSNPQESIDYMLRIEGKGPSETVDQASCIIGAGALGQSLKNEMGRPDDVLLGRGENIPEVITNASGEAVSSFPIYVAVPSWEVEAVIKQCPTNKRQDLVFTQTECMESVLKRYGLCKKEQTQLLPYFRISPIGRPIEGRVQFDTSPVTGEPKFTGETVVCGKWRGAVAERLKRKGLYCEPLDYTYWRKFMFERLIFDSVFNLVGSVHEGVETFEDLALSSNHLEEIQDMSAELARCLRSTLACALLSGTDERIVGYALSERVKVQRPVLPPAHLYPLRNGFFREISRQFTERGFRSPCPMHDEYLEYVRDQDKLSYAIDPPPTQP